MSIRQPSVLIIILNYGTFDLTIRLIEALKSKLDYENYTIMVIDNCSPNESAEVLEAKSNSLDFIFYLNNNNSGYAAGNNIGIKYGIEHGFDYSWILNNDVELRDSSILKHMVSIAENDKSIGCVGPMIYSLDGTICSPYCRRPTISSMTLLIGAEKKYRRRFNFKSGIVYRVYGCCMLLNNNVMNEINCMDERTFLYGEEDILAERMLKNGYSSYYDSDVSVTHKESSSIKQMSRSRKKFQIRETCKSMELYLKEYRHFSAFERFICILVRRLIIWFR